MQWYYSKNGTQLGPVQQGELISKLASGEISTADLVWREGMGDWLPAGQVAELKSISAPIPAALDPSLPYAAPSSPYAPPVVPQVGTGKATSSMVLGIVSLVTGLLCGCLVGLPCGILAVVFGNQYQKAAQQNPLLVPDLSKAKAGVLMGWIGIALSVISTIAGVFFQMNSGAFQIPK